MLKVNLEQKLVKNKQKLLTKSEKMVLEKNSKMHDSMTKEDIQILKQYGLWKNNEKKLEKIRKKQSINDRFPKERVFHTDDIKKLCVNYGLRFLPSEMYNGDIDPELPNKIKEFDSKYGTTKGYGYTYSSYIAAPVKNFELQERPKDPLFFMDLGEGYYYLLHKWGEDISVFRWLINLPMRNSVVLNVLLISVFSVMMYAATFYHLEKPKHGPDVIWYLLSFILTVFLGFVVNIIFGFMMRKFFKGMNGTLSFPGLDGNNHKWSYKYFD